MTRLDLLNQFGYGDANNVEQYKQIVKYRSYYDMQPRTIKGLAEFRSEPENNTHIINTLEKLGEELHDYVTKAKISNQTDFDTWHEKTCKWFVKEFNKSKKLIGYGKAQKIVNVSFKYILALQGADKYWKNGKFKYCHMTLDRYTFNEGFYKKEIDDKNKAKKLSTMSWSKLEYQDYINIQKNVRNFLSNVNKYGPYLKVNGEKSLSPFEAEFYIFEHYKNKINLKS